MSETERRTALHCTALQWPVGVGVGVGVCLSVCGRCGVSARPAQPTSGSRSTVTRHCTAPPAQNSQGEATALKASSSYMHSGYVHWYTGTSSGSPLIEARQTCCTLLNCNTVHNGGVNQLFLFPAFALPVLLFFYSDQSTNTKYRYYWPKRCKYSPEIASTTQFITSKLL